MQVDWFTVAAQIVNLLVLVYLLKRFLYGPIVKAMDERERRVTDRLRRAQEREEAAEAREAEFRARSEELEERRRKLLDAARDEAAERKQELVADVRQEVDEIRSRWHREVENERESFLRDLRGQAASWLARATRRALRDLADTELEERVVAAFADRIRSLDAEARDRLREVVREGGEAPCVVTTFELAGPQRDALRDALDAATGERLDLRFAESADLVCGIELRTAGHVLAWSLDAFVGDLADEVGEGLRRAASSSGASLEEGADETREAGERDGGGVARPEAVEERE